MSEFKFAFNTDPEIESDSNNENGKRNNDALNWLEAAEVLPTDNIVKNVDELFPKAKILVYGNLDIGHVILDDAVRYLKESNSNTDSINDVLQAESQHSDLLAGKYEGGLKIWECTNDLAEYLTNSKIEWKDIKVLDLGCGAGILGIFALLSGAEVHFQDYNKEVINTVTIPNCLLNIQPEERQTIKTKCKFFSGDWGSLPKLLESDMEINKYKIILSSETIYNTDNHRKIYDLIKNHLEKDGIAYVAAKSYYFGVGGSVKQFQDLVESGGTMSCDICWKSAGGVKREIIKITFK